MYMFSKNYNELFSYTNYQQSVHLQCISVINIFGKTHIVDFSYVLVLLIIQILSSQSICPQSLI